jgi:hypothetical protein
MGLGEKLKDIYYLGEEKWYGFWDKVDEHIPIYGVIDPIDNVIPSFALFLILIFLILLLIGGSILGLTGGAAQATLKVSVVDSSGNSISGALVTIEGISEEFTTNDYGLISPVLVPLNSLVNIDAKKGTKQKSTSILMDSAEKIVEITLGKGELQSIKSIRLRTESGEIVSGEVQLEFKCSTNAEAPGTQTIYNGTTNVSYSEEDCGILSVTATSPKFELKTFTLINPSTEITLVSNQPTETIHFTVNLKENGVLITEPVTVQAYNGSNTFIAYATKQSYNGQAVFDLPVGTYKFAVRQEQGYKATEANSIDVSQTSTKTLDIVMQKSLLGIISVITRRGSVALSDVRLTLSKKQNGLLTEVFNTDSNSDGEAQFEITDDATYVITATLDDYCDQVFDANIGDIVVFNLKRNDGTCGQKLGVQVLDQDNKPVAYAKVAIFGVVEGEAYKLAQTEKVTDYNGYVSWNPVPNSKSSETYKVFAFKATYSGWSEAKEFNAQTATTPFTVKLQIPLGTVNVIVKDIDNNPIQFAEAQLFDEYVPEDIEVNNVSGKRIVENVDGTIQFSAKADKKVYVVITKEGYESYTTAPKQLIGDGTINFEVTLQKPPVQALSIRPLGLFKNDESVSKVEAGGEYDALFEINAPKSYDELGFFVRVGRNDITKTELDKIFIKQVIAPGKKYVLTGATYNKPQGYSIDEEYTNLEESKWAQVIWPGSTYEPGKIIVGVKVKIRSTAQAEERLDIGFRAWGVLDGDYERNPLDSELGTAAEKASKDQLYAATEEEYISVGTETLCDKPTEEKSFCITSTYTDQDNFTQSFTDSFDAKASTPYTLSVKIQNSSLISFDNAKLMIENPEENLILGNYALYTPQYQSKQGIINGVKTEWIDTPGFAKNTAIDIVTLQVTPQKTGTGTLNFKIRENSAMVYQKAFTLNIISSKKMKIQYMEGSTFTDTMPKIVSGKTDQLTIKALNTESGLEVQNAIVRIYDRFGTEIVTSKTNKLGVAVLTIPASFPGEKLKLQIEAVEFETLEKEFNIAEDVVSINPKELSFTVNPQIKQQDLKTVKIENKTGLDLTIKSITLTGKLKGLLSESKIESWFDNYKGIIIKSQDYEEIDFKVISATVIPSADDLEAEFEVMVGAEGKEWVTTIPTKIRVGLGKDVDNASCLGLTKTNWEATTRGNQIEIGLELVNNCTVDGKTVPLKNLGATLSTTSSIAGTFNAQSRTAQVELGTAYSRVFRTTINETEKIPITIKFTPSAGSAGVTTGSIIFEAKNQTDSKDQKLTAELKYNITYENMQDCLVIGSDLVTIKVDDKGDGTGKFTIQNNCKTKTTIQIDRGDLESAVSDTTFTLNSTESKEINIVASKGQQSGMYNLKIKARQTTTTLEVIDNVKVLIEDPYNCFSLTRYEYDVYDSQYNDYDGTDTGYLRNNCYEKNVGVKVSGTIPYDTSKLWRSALIGALAGGIGNYVKTGEVTGWTGKKAGENVSSWKERFQIDIKQRILQDTANADGIIAGLTTSNETLSLNKMTDDLINDLYARGLKYASEYSDIAQELNKRGWLDSAPKDAGNLIKSIKDTSTVINTGEVVAEALVENKTVLYFASPLSPADLQCKNALLDKAILLRDTMLHLSDAITQLKQIKANTSNSVSSMSSKLNSLKKQLINDVETKGAKYSARIAKGQSPEDGKTQQDTFDQDAKLSETTFNTEAGKIKTDLTKLVKEATDQMNQIKTNLKLDETEQQKKQLEDKIITACAVKPQAVNAECGKWPGVCTKGDYDGKPYTDDTEKKQVTWGCNGKGGGTNITCSYSYGTVSPTTLDTIKEKTAAVQEKADKEKIQSTNLGTEGADKGTSSLNSTLPYTLIRDSIPSVDLTALGFSSQLMGGYTSYSKTESKGCLVDGSSQVTNPCVITAVVYDTKLTGLNVNEKLVKSVAVSSSILADFLLTSGSGASTITTANSSSNNSLFGGNSSLINTLIQGGSSYWAGSQAKTTIGGALGGAVVSFLWEYMQAKNTDVAYSDTFTMPLVVLDGNKVKLTSSEGITLKVGGQTFDYDNYYGLKSESSSSTTTTSYTGNVLYNSSALSATMGTVEERELTFSNPSKAVNDNAYSPFVGILTVPGTEKIYNTSYNYDDVKAKAIARGDYTESEKGIGSFFSNLFKPTGVTDSIAQIADSDLNIKETRAYNKKFHLLFDAYEYVDCGPKTYPCQATQISNCDIDGKKGVTGEEGVPKIQLAWNWDEVDIDACDSSAREDYVYCDSTQFTISTLKKLLAIKSFLNNTSLTSCPSAIDIIGTKTQSLKSNALDVGITSIEVKPSANGAIVTAIVETNNNLEMSARVGFKFSRQDGTSVGNNGVVCSDVTKTFTSSEKFNCIVDSNVVGSGYFNIDATMTPTLCTGCGNYDTINDKIKTALVIGSTGTTQNCKDYSTNRDYFEKVLSANNKLSTGSTILSYLSFKTNLVRDGFSEDFKNDFDDFIDTIAGAPTTYRTEGLRDLFLSSKLKVKWPDKPSAWNAGKYDATIVIKFNNNSWNWTTDANNIDSVTINLDPQGDPDPYYPIYNVAFDSIVGMTSDDGRQGYGAGFVQKTEDLFTIAEDGPTKIVAQPKAASNALTTVNVSVVKGTSAFNLLNSTPTRGNVLSIARTGDEVDFVITPSVIVPLILNVTRKTSTDAYAFYSAEVNGQPQDLGQSFIYWTGIGQGCVDFSGMAMTGWYKTADAKASTIMTGFDGYGLGWPMATLDGTASFYGAFFAPQDSLTILKMMGARDTASFETSGGQKGETITVSTTGEQISNLKDVLDLVKDEKVCVIGGDYYWNNDAIREGDLKTSIDSKENTCIAS